MNQANIRIKQHYSIIPHSPDLVEIRSGVWNPTSFMLSDHSQSGNLFKIVAALNGQASTGEIAKQHHLSRAEVEGVVDQLHQLDVIENAQLSLHEYMRNGTMPQTAINADVISPEN